MQIRIHSLKQWFFKKRNNQNMKLNIIFENKMLFMNLHYCMNYYSRYSIIILHKLQYFAFSIFDWIKPWFGSKFNIRISPLFLPIVILNWKPSLKQVVIQKCMYFDTVRFEITNGYTYCYNPSKVIFVFCLLSTFNFYLQ